MIASVFVAFLISFDGDKAYGFEEDMPNLAVPTRLKPLDLLIGIRHQFYGPVDEDPGDTALGMDAGANVNLGFRFVPVSILEVHASRTSFRKEKSAGAAYTLDIPVIRTSVQAGIQYFSFEDLEIPGTNRSGYFSQLSVATDPILGRIKPVVNAGYDSLNERYGFGAGLSITLVREFIYLQGELFPYLHKKEIHEYDTVFEERGLGRGPVYCAGIMIQTEGHHFKIYVSNTYETSNRRLMMGSALDKPFLGFVIQRRFSF